MPDRYEALAKALLTAPDPLRAVASELGDHAGRLDALASRLAHVEAELANLRSR